MPDPLFPYQQAKAAADELVDQLRPACHKIEIAGSIRREKKFVHDIDLVLYPIYEEACLDLLGFEYAYFVPALEDALGMIRIESGAKIVRFSKDDIPVELYLANVDGANFEALWQMRTGSAEFNIRLAQRAVKLGKSYRAGHGIFDPWGKRVDDGTERGIFTCLGLDWVEPQGRG